MLLLVISLLLLLLISYIIFKKDFLSPSFVFTAGFCYSSVWAYFFRKKWSLNLNTNTYLVIVGGVLTFLMFSIIINKSIGNKKKPLEISFNDNYIRIEFIKNLLILCIEIFTFVFTIYELIKLTGGSLGNIGDMIYKYRYANTFTDTPMYFPKLLSFLRIFSLACGYYYGFVFINNFVSSKKIIKIEILIVIMSILNMIITGARGGAINLIIGIMAWYIMVRDRNGKKIRINKKFLVRVLVLAIVFLLSFRYIGGMLGRNSSSKISGTEYLAHYSGAQIKLLDMYLQEDKLAKSDFFGQQTFIYMIKWLGPVLGMNNTNYTLDIPFKVVNGVNIGNVYTTFYAFIYDFGYIGVFVLTALMAIISQLIYEKSRRKIFVIKPSIYVLMYGFIIGSLLLSFFSNKFYEQNFNKQFIYSIIIWNLLNFFNFRIKIANK